MPLTSYDLINTLDEDQFIAGTNYTYTFLVNDVNGSPINLTSGTAKWTLCYYGQPDYAVVTKAGVIDPIITNQVTITLLTADTETLSGKFIQQIVVIDYNGQEYRVSQGVITIIPRINNP